MKEFNLKDERRFDAFAREHVYPEKAIKKLIEEYCKKLRKMEVVSVEVAIYELQQIVGELK